MDIAMGDVPERVLDNTIFEDAYLCYKKKSSQKDFKKRNEQIKAPQNKADRETAPKSKWLFNVVGPGI